jgi:acetolactate synthase small subunit
MSESHNFTIQSLHAPTVLPRVALLFSKRRLPIDRLEMYALDAGDHAMLAVEARCDGATAEKVAQQMRRIVEVSDVQVNTAANIDVARRA